jgi:hypothetical protein
VQPGPGDAAAFGDVIVLSLDANNFMPLLPADVSRLDDYRFQMGHDAGSLAIVLDQLTDVMSAVAQHAVHCRVERGNRAGEPPLDVVQLIDMLQTAKGLVQETLLRLKD